MRAQFENYHYIERRYYTTIRATLDVKLALLSMGIPNRPALSLHSCFVEASLMVEKPDRLIPSLPSFQNIRRLWYANFILQAENVANKATDGHARNFDASDQSWRLKHIRMVIAAMYMSSADFLSIHYAKI